MLQKFSSLEDPVFDKTYSIYEIAFRRGLSVFLGVIAGMLVSRFIWPFQARTALRKGISLVYQDISSLLIRLLELIDSNTLPLLSDLQTVTNLELNLRKTHSELETSLEEANHEESNFPNRSYAQILLSIENILNRFSSIRMSACQDGFPLSSRRKADHIEYLCRDMIDQVLLHFYVLSGAMKLKYALPPKLSDTHGSRIRLLNAISKLPTPRGPFYIAYVLEDVIEELIILEDLTRSLFGSFSKLSSDILICTEE